MIQSVCRSEHIPIKHVRHLVRRNALTDLSEANDVAEEDGDAVSVLWLDLFSLHKGLCDMPREYIEKKLV